MDWGKFCLHPPMKQATLPQVISRWRQQNPHHHSCTIEDSGEAGTKGQRRRAREPSRPHPRITPRITINRRQSPDEGGWGPTPQLKRSLQPVHLIQTVCRTGVPNQSIGIDWSITERFPVDRKKCLKITIKNKNLFLMFHLCHRSPMSELCT